MNLLHKTEELSRFENELFLLYSIIAKNSKNIYIYIYRFKKRFGHYFGIQSLGTQQQLQ